MKKRMPMLQQSDPILFDMCAQELNRQRNSLEMIASESFVPPEIMELQGSVFTNKTTEGYPGKRYHAGCQVVDEMERLAISRARELFGADHHPQAPGRPCLHGVPFRKPADPAGLPAQLRHGS